MRSVTRWHALVEEERPPSVSYPSLVPRFRRSLRNQAQRARRSPHASRRAAWASAWPVPTQGRCIGFRHDTARAARRAFGRFWKTTSLPPGKRSHPLARFPVQIPVGDRWFARSCSDRAHALRREARAARRPDPGGERAPERGRAPTTCRPLNRRPATSRVALPPQRPDSPGASATTGRGVSIRESGEPPGPDAVAAGRGHSALVRRS
jgi:hypothetical protein